MRRILEVCCGDAESVKAAIAGGADRIELCQSLETGGLTPSAGLIDFAVRLAPGRVNVLIRPRSGDFLYTPDELDVIEGDIYDAIARGASGIVFGALTSDGMLDADVMRRMLEAAGGVSFTLHRAFDMCRNPEEALEQAVALGIDRILTSGLAPDVMAGAYMLNRLNRQAAGRIIILAGGGVTPDNVGALIEGTGVREVHASCKVSRKSAMQWQRGDVSMSTPGTDEFSYPGTSQEIVSLIAKRINQ